MRFGKSGQLAGLVGKLGVFGLDVLLAAVGIRLPSFPADDGQQRHNTDD